MPGVNALRPGGRPGYQYDVCLSFASEQRAYVERVAERVRNGGAEVFYDNWNTAHCWGRNLVQYFDRIYRADSHYCVIFISADYANKAWPTQELESAQARAFERKEEYILPARFDDTEIPGILSTTGCLDLRKYSADELADMILEKIRDEGSIWPPSHWTAKLKYHITDRWWVSTAAASAFVSTGALLATNHRASHSVISGLLVAALGYMAAVASATLIDRQK
jgi:hypothetical protein